MTPPFPPGPTSALPAGLLFRFRRDPLRFLEDQLPYGPITSFAIGPRRIYILNEAEAIQQVLVGQNKHFEKFGSLSRAKGILGEGLLTSEAEFHLRQRRLMQPAFHRQHLASYADTMRGFTERMCARWQPGETLSLDKEMMQLTLEIAGKTLFGCDVEQDTIEVGIAVEELMGLFETVSLPFAELIQRLPVPRYRRAWKALARLEALIYRLIEQRRKEDYSARADLLSMLLAARDTDDGGVMTDRQVRDEAITAFLAGHETTAIALTWTFYLLSQHPDALARLRAEVEAVVGDRPLTYQDLPKLTFTDQVFSEALRLYPPGWMVVRRALAPVDLGKWQLPRGAIVMLSPYLTQRNPAYYPAPERFDPERFAPDAKASRPKFAYFPFGGGARGCIGEPFAWMEAMIVLATVTRHWSLNLVPGHPVARTPLVTLHPTHGMRMTAEPR